MGCFFITFLVGFGILFGLAYAVVKLEFQRTWPYYVVAPPLAIATTALLCNWLTE